MLHGIRHDGFFGFDLALRLTSMNHDLGGTTHDAVFSYNWTVASQLARRQSPNGLLSGWPVAARNDTYTVNGLNQYTQVTGRTYVHDDNGNLINNGIRNYAYDVENRLVSVSGSPSMTLSYDPLGRLRQTVAGTSTVQFLYEGDRLIAEYNGSTTTVLRRYVHGPGIDEPIVWYEGSNLSDRRWLHTDERGSVIAHSVANGNATTYSYGPYGEPGNDNWTGSRFRYTGQIALPEARLYHYKARVYDPIDGRFLQTDPIGYEDDLNLYAYTGNDPVNARDPSGQWAWVAAGAVLSGGAQAFSEYRNGTLNSWQGAARVATAAAVGAATSAGAGLIGRTIVAETFGAAGLRAGANGLVGGGAGALQTETNARIASGGESGASGGDLARGALTGGLFSAAGSAGGDAVRAGVNRLGAGSSDPRIAAAEADRLVQGQGMPGGVAPPSGAYDLGSFPAPPPSQTGVVLGNATSALISAGQPPACGNQESTGCQ